MIEKVLSESEKTLIWLCWIQTIVFYKPIAWEMPNFKY